MSRAMLRQQGGAEGPGPGQVGGHVEQRWAVEGSERRAALSALRARLRHLLQALVAFEGAG